MKSLLKKIALIFVLLSSSFLFGMELDDNGYYVVEHFLNEKKSSGGEFFGVPGGGISQSTKNYIINKSKNISHAVALKDLFCSKNIFNVLSHGNLDDKKAVLANIYLELAELKNNKAFQDNMLRLSSSFASDGKKFKSSKFSTLRKMWNKTGGKINKKWKSNIKSAYKKKLNHDKRLIENNIKMEEERVLEQDVLNTDYIEIVDDLFPEDKIDLNDSGLSTYETNGQESENQTFDPCPSYVPTSCPNNVDLLQDNGKSESLVVKDAEQKLDFSKKVPVMQVVDSVVQTGLRNVLLDDGLDGTIKKAMDQIGSEFSPRDLSFVFEKKYINSYKEQEVRQDLNSSSNNRIEFKKNIENKIILTEDKLNSFYDKCSNNYINKNKEPLSYFYNEYSKETCHVVRYGLDLAKDYNVSNQLEIANDITDFSTSLLDVAKGTAKFLKLVGKGSFQAVRKYKNPIKVIKDFGMGFVNLGVGLGKLTLKFAEFNYLAIKDPEMAERQAKRFWTSASKKLKKMEQRFSRLSYEEKVVFISKTLTEIVVDGAFIGGALKLGSKAATFLKAIPNLVEKEVAVAKLATKFFKGKVSDFKEVLTPLANAGMETKECVKIAGMNGVKLSRASLSLISKDKSIIQAERSIAQNVSKIIDKTKKTKDKFINLASKGRTDHVIVGERYSLTKFNGGHKFPGNPGKSAFPKSWSKDKIMHEISDIATDPNLQWIPRGGNRFIVEGIRDKVNIRVVIEPAGERIITGFPLNGPGVTCKAKNI